MPDRNKRRSLPAWTPLSASLLLVLAMATGCEEVPPCPGLPDDIPSDWTVVPPGVDTAEWDAWMEDRMREGCFPAVSVSVVTEDGEILRAAWGHVHVESESPVTTQTPFMAASVSKAIDALAIVAAQEDGLLDLDDEVSALVDFDVENPRMSDPPAIRMRHLVTHSSGIEDNWSILGDTYVDGDSPVPLGTFLRDYLEPGGRQFSKKGNFFVWPAGREWMYSNVGTALAAYAVEVQSGQPYWAYCEDRLFTPLELTDTAWFLADFEDPELIARPHQATWDGWLIREHYGYPTYPDGQLRTTATDLGRILRVAIGDGEVDGQRILEPGVRAALTEEVPVSGLNDWFLRDYFDQQYLFWFSTKLGDRRIVGHNGGDFGVSTEMFFDPETDVGVVVLTNGDDGPVGDRLRAETRAIQQRLFALGEANR